MDKNSKKMEKQNQTMNKNEITLPMLGISRLGFPVIEAEFQDKMLVFLLDTGSDSNLLDERVYNIFKDEMKVIGKDGYVIGVDGIKNPKGPKVQMRLGFDDQSIEVPFCTIPIPSFDIIHKAEGIQIHGILGIPFMMANGMILDFTNSSARLRHPCQEKRKACV